MNESKYKALLERIRDIADSDLIITLVAGDFDADVDFDDFSDIDVSELPLVDIVNSVSPDELMNIVHEQIEFDSVIDGKVFTSKEKIEVVVKATVNLGHEEEEINVVLNKSLNLKGDKDDWVSFFSFLEQIASEITSEFKGENEDDDDDEFSFDLS